MVSQGSSVESRINIRCGKTELCNIAFREMGKQNFYFAHGTFVQLLPFFSVHTFKVILSNIINDKLMTDVFLIVLKSFTNVSTVCNL